MRFFSCCHLILLYPLLLMTPLVHAQQSGRDTLVLHFASDRYEVRSEDTAQAARLFHDPAFSTKKIDSILITGYTDKTGTTAYNFRLSARRAAAADAWLRKRLSAAGTVWQPPAEPDARVLARKLVILANPGGVAPTPDQSDSANRRAEIVISYAVAAPPVATPRHDSARLSSAAADSTGIIAGVPDSTRSTAMIPDSSKPTAVISLQHINFVLDTPIPTDATRMILPGYVTLLQQYKDRYLEIDGYVNSFTPLHGVNDPLFILSVKRAKFIYDYLVDAGFDPNRLSYKGMGNSSPVNPNPATREEMYANMRVEIKVY